jgi:hypothetical protein
LVDLRHGILKFCHSLQHLQKFAAIRKWTTLSNFV